MLTKNLPQGFWGDLLLDTARPIVVLQIFYGRIAIYYVVKAVRKLHHARKALQLFFFINSGQRKTKTIIRINS